MAEGDKDWGKFFNQLFEKGKAFTQNLMKENERLRGQIAYLENELAQAPQAAPGEDTEIGRELQEIRRERDSLRRALGDLKQRVTKVERENQEFADRYQQIELQNASFASLYVASYSLHSTLAFEEVIKRIKEVLIDLVGAEAFALYLFDAKLKAFILVGGEGVDGRVGNRIPLGNNRLSTVAQSGELYLSQDPRLTGDDEHPIAALPLKTSEELVGVVVVYKLLIQKDGFEPVDLELFNLLAGHAATALMAAQLYARSQRKVSTLEGAIQMLKGPSLGKTGKPEDQP